MTPGILNVSEVVGQFAQQRQKGQLVSGLGRVWLFAPTPPRNYREMIHGETGNGDPLWGWNAALPVRPIHGGSGCHFMVIWTQFAVIWIHGGL